MPPVGPAAYDENEEVTVHTVAAGLSFMGSGADFQAQCERGPH
jgi:hypothetical protein